MRQLREAARATFDFVTFRRMPIGRKFQLLTLGVSFWYWVIGIVGIVHQDDLAGVVGIVVALVVAHVMLVAFAWTASKSFTVPIRGIFRQVREMTKGEMSGLTHIEVTDGDEVGELAARFNDLLDALHGLAQFRKVIEQDDSTSDVYARLGAEFAARGLVQHQILALDPAAHTLRPATLDAPQRWCAASLAEGANPCRALRTAQLVSSEAYAGVCKLFEPSDVYHACVPMMLGGTVGGVAQFVYGGAAGPTAQEFAPRLAIARRYLHEALPVLETRRLTDSLRDAAVRDGMTGLYNRRFLEEAQGQLVAIAKRRASTLAVVLCDVDHFKRVNDVHGHPAGDEVLRVVARALRAGVRASDHAVRYGGEEFLLLLHDTDRAGAALVAERVRAAVEACEIGSDSASVRVTMSFGVAELPSDDPSLWEVIKLADQALYEAKAGGRNRVVVRPAGVGALAAPCSGALGA